MDDLKQINLSDTSINQESSQEEFVMEPVNKSKIMPILITLAIVIGLGGGFYLAQKQLLLAGGTSTLAAGNQELTSSTTLKVGDVFGSADEKTFSDTAEGILQPGGIEGEGSHHIERGDNKSQWVYVTSSVVDLDLIVGHRVTVWGQTNTGKKAGWLMDIGRLKVVELDAAPVTIDEVTQD